MPSEIFRFEHLESGRQRAEQLDADAEPNEGRHAAVLNRGRKLHPVQRRNGAFSEGKVGTYSASYKPQLLALPSTIAKGRWVRDAERQIAASEPSPLNLIMKGCRLGRSPNEGLSSTLPRLQSTPRAYTACDMRNFYCL